MDLCQKYRPKETKDVIGQQAAIKVVDGWIERKEIPHTVMFTGPSGCGKTTLARILATKLDCHVKDTVELNIADNRGIDMARELRQSAKRYGMFGKSRCFILDEFHQATKDAQNALLKILEEPSDHIHYFICTTEPGKLLKTIQTRCTEVKCKAVSEADLQSFISKVWKVESRDTRNNEVSIRIAEVADGSPRKALKLLESVIHMTDEEQMLDCVQSSESRQFAINLARCLINPRSKFAEAAAMLRSMEDDPETVRQVAMTYATSVMLNNGKMAKYAAKMLSCFQEPIYSAPKQLLALAVYDFYHLS